MPQYFAKFVTPERTASVLVEPTKWGRPYKELHEQTEAGHVIWSLYSHNNFRNRFHDADIARYQERGYWAEISRDTVRGREKELGETQPSEGFVPVTYIAGAGLPYEIIVNTWLPQRGLLVPVHDNAKGYRFFKPRTLVPEKTVPFDERTEAERIFARFNLPAEEISGFQLADDYRNEEYFAGRDFGPDIRDVGRFYVDLGRRPSDPGDARVASRPRYEEPELLMKVKF